MKKFVSIVSIFLILILSMSISSIYAATLSNIEVTIDKEKVNPNGEIKVSVSFGAQLGAYTFDIAYDKNLVEYVSAEGGTASDDGTRVRVVYPSDAGTSGTRENMSVTFKAKSDIVTTNPTNFGVTATGLAGAIPIITYDAITTPIVKNFVVEPVYLDYNIALTYTGDIEANTAKNMIIAISSSMGKSYEHARLIATATTPTGGNVTLTATDSENLKHDIIQSGWGPAEGDALGGKNVLKQINASGLFSKEGQYAITLKLIDRDNSDEVIASKTFDITVSAATTTTPTPSDTETGMDDNDETTTGKQDEKMGGAEVSSEDKSTANTQKSSTETLPKTGNIIYVAILPVVAVLALSYIWLRKK